MAEQSQNELLAPALRAKAEGRLADALSLLRSLAAQHPTVGEIYQLAGECLLESGDFRAALDAFRRAIDVRTDWPDPYLGAARSLEHQGDAFGSMQTLLHVLSFAPGHLPATAQLIDLLAQLRPDSHLPVLEPALLACFAHSHADPSPLSKLCADQLRFKLGDAVDGPDEDLARLAARGPADTELLRLYLARVVNCDPKLERLLTRLRRRLCLDSSLDDARNEPLTLIAALALQCFLNEYVFALSDDEERRLEDIERRLEGEQQTISEATALAFALASLYRSPSTDEAGQRLAGKLSRSFGWVSELCRITVFEPAEEERLAADIKTLYPVADECSRAVQAQYEINPYPRWQIPPAPRQSNVLEDIRRRFSRRDDREPAPVEKARVLVAGCGTGFEPIDIALRDGELEITAIDLSRRSLAYAKRQAQAAGCRNIQFYQADILDLQQTDRAFDLIVCTGVLHHMAEPLAGWRALRGLLGQDGMMRISLYSAHARRAIRTARDAIASRELAGTVDDIREFRRALMMEQASRPEFAALLQSDDFYSMSGCRDLLFHVQEHQFTLPQIEAALESLALRFCGFDPPDAALLHAFARGNPGAAALRDLDAWDRFEQGQPDAFAGMYQFWCEPR